MFRLGKQNFCTDPGGLIDRDIAQNSIFDLQQTPESLVLMVLAVLLFALVILLREIIAGLGLLVMVG